LFKPLPQSFADKRLQRLITVVGYNAMPWSKSHIQAVLTTTWCFATNSTFRLLCSRD